MGKRLRLAGLAALGLLAVWYRAVLVAGEVKARKQAWREVRRARVGGRRG